MPDSDARWAQALEALRGVWASKYNDRAYYSMKKVGLNFDDVRMAVLVQRVVPAHYAFVIHTKNPSNNDENEVFCELVQGLGEWVLPAPQGHHNPIGPRKKTCFWEIYPT